MLIRVTTGPARNAIALTFALLVMPLYGCSSDPAATPGDSGADGQGSRDSLASDVSPSDGAPTDDGASGGKLLIRVGGDTTAKTINDGFAGQTPTKYTMSLARYEIMTSATDPQPVLVFDHQDKPVEVDMLAGPQVVGSAALSTIPSGTYTHGRVLLTATRYVVATTVHATTALPGTVEVVAALSNTTIEGESWAQGKVSFTFSIWPTPIPGTLPPLPPTPGGQIVQKDGETWMVFPFTKPLAINSSSKASWQATIVYDVANSFRWLDDSSIAGYKKDVFDVSVLPQPSFETVKSFGATGYTITEEQL